MISSHYSRLFHFFLSLKRRDDDGDGNDAGRVNIVSSYSDHPDRKVKFRFARPECFFSYP